MENRISGTSRFYGYVSDLHGFTLQLSSTRLDGNQSSSFTSGLVLGSFMINRERKRALTAFIRHDLGVRILD